MLSPRVCRRSTTSTISVGAANSDSAPPYSRVRPARGPVGVTSRSMFDDAAMIAAPGTRLAVCRQPRARSPGCEADPVSSAHLHGAVSRLRDGDLNARATVQGSTSWLRCQGLQRNGHGLVSRTSALETPDHLRRQLSPCLSRTHEPPDVRARQIGALGMEDVARLTSSAGRKSRAPRTKRAD
jgi:hypothetical protein